MATTSVRNEALLGAVRSVELDEEAAGGQRKVRAAYELNVIDGWVKVTERTDGTGTVWEGASRVRSRVGEVLDAAPECAEFITKGHLLWITALRGAERAQRATGQRSALIFALRRHGLALNPESSLAYDIDALVR